MEKNVPLLKLIQDPWSIKTMLSSRFMCVPLHPRTPADNNTSGSLSETTNQRKTKQKGIKQSGEGGRGAGPRPKKTQTFSFFLSTAFLFFFFVHGGCIVAVVCVLAAVGRCRCSELSGPLRVPNTRTEKAGPFRNHRRGGEARSTFSSCPLTTFDVIPPSNSPCICSYFPTNFFPFQLL